MRRLREPLSTRCVHDYRSIHCVLGQEGQAQKQHARQLATVYAACNASSLWPFRLDSLDRLPWMVTQAARVGGQIEDDQAANKLLYVELTWHCICFRDYT